VSQTNETTLIDIINHTPLAIWELTADKNTPKFTTGYINPYFMKITGIDQASWHDTPDIFTKLIYPEDRKLTKNHLTKALDHQQQAPLKHRWISEDGKVIWMETRLHVIKDDIGKKCRIRGCSANITNQIQTQTALHFIINANSLLTSSFDYRDSLKKVAQLAIKTYECDLCSVDLVTNDKKTIDNIATAHRNNEVADKIIEYRRLHTLPLNDIFGIGKVIKNGTPEFHPTLSSDLVATMPAVIQPIVKLLSINSYICVPILVRNKIFGAITFVSSSKSITFTEQDLNTAIELSRLIAVTIENADLYQEATNAIKIRDEFLSIASHELKTPLTSLTLHLELLRHRQSEFTDSSKLHIDKIQDQITKLTSLVNDLLNVSRIASGKIVYQHDWFDLSDLIKNSIASFTRQEQRILFEPKEKAAYFGDSIHLGQAVLNLISNALKYSPENSLVTITLHKTRDAFKIIVSDQGLGIDRADHEKIFERFYQIKDTKNGRTYPGFGIGLYIARQIIRIHGGDITVDSTKGTGSVFTISLPINKLPIQSLPDKQEIARYHD
jgi:PAS domain S-box-containing protein